MPLGVADGSRAVCCGFDWLGYLSLFISLKFLHLQNVVIFRCERLTLG